jgi:hypothetical protein
MEDVTRKRIMRMLDRLPEEQLYQVLDYIEFLEVKYARETARKPDAFQEFAERVEDQLRVRSLAPRAMKGTLRLMSTAGRVLDGVRDLGKGLKAPTENGPGPRGAGAKRSGGEAGEAGEAGPERRPERGTEGSSGEG